MSIRGCGGGGRRRTDLRKGKLEIRWGRAIKKGGANVAKFDVFLMQMMQGFLADDASDALVFGKEPLPIGENVIKICIIWRAGDANDASI